MMRLTISVTDHVNRYQLYTNQGLRC